MVLGRMIGERRPSNPQIPQNPHRTPNQQIEGSRPAAYFIIREWRSSSTGFPLRKANAFSIPPTDIQPLQPEQPESGDHESEMTALVSASDGFGLNRLNGLQILLRTRDAFVSTRGASPVLLREVRTCDHCERSAS